MSGFLFDSNVLLDIATADAVWLSWAEARFREVAAQGPILVNPIIYAELAPAFATREALEQWLAPAVFHRLPLPYAAGWRAAQALSNIAVRVEPGHRPCRTSTSERTPKLRD